MALPPTGCTIFLLRMMEAPDAKLRAADISKLSAKYSVGEKWAEMAVKQWLNRSN